jgi:nucleoside-triphosphatase
MILLTALPRTGKSTAIHKIIQMLGIKNCGGFYTEEIREDGERVGFRIKTLSGKTGLLSHVNIESEYRISRYGVDLVIFEKICLEELKNAIDDKKIKYIIIDEIGPMQLFSEEYKKLLIELLKSKKQVVGTIFMNPYEWLDDFKKMNGVELIEISIENRDSLPLQIVDMLTKNDEKMQRKISKAIRYSSEKERFILFDDRIEVHSEHGIRTIKLEDSNYACNCDFYKENGTCSHIMAVISLNLNQHENNKKQKIKK